MIEALYAVNFLKGHLQRFKKYNRINATIDCGDNYVSFYAKDDNSSKQYLARGSDHQLRMQHLADKDEPWKGDNISIVFITPKSPQDVRIRQRVMQNHYGSIKPFDVTTYQYDNTILDERDLSRIFRSIISFLNGGGYNDPFKGTPKAAKVIPRTSDIKPYKEPTRKARNISVDKDGNYVSANAWGADYVSENKDIKQYTNMNKKQIRLTESDLKQIVKESVNKILYEAYNPYNELQRFAYENQQVRPMIQKLADFAEDVAQIGKMRGKDNYYQFYHKLNGDILQMNNLWNFLDDIDD